MLLEVHGLSKTISKKKILQNLSFTLKKGEITALLGPNGAGKSTTVQILTGLRKPSEGKVSIYGRLGYASQEVSFPTNLKCIEIIKFVQAHFEKKYLTPMDQLIADFGLEKILYNQTNVLSGGQKRRLAMACVFANSPEIIILDEPTTGLDLEAKISLWNYLNKYKKNGGSVLLSTHDLIEIEKIADQVLLIDSGKSLFFGSLRKILSTINIKKVHYKIGVLQKAEYVENSDEFIYTLVEKKIKFSNLWIERASLEEVFLHYQERKYEF